MRTAASELPRDIRVNVVSPSWDIETLMALKMDPSLGMPAAQVARAYLPSMEGIRHGTDHRSRHQGFDVSGRAYDIDPNAVREFQGGAHMKPSPPAFTKRKGMTL